MRAGRFRSRYGQSMRRVTTVDEWVIWEKGNEMGEGFARSALDFAQGMRSICQSSQQQESNHQTASPLPSSLPPAHQRQPEATWGGGALSAPPQLWFCGREALNPDERARSHNLERPFGFGGRGCGHPRPVSAVGHSKTPVAAVKPVCRCIPSPAGPKGPSCWRVYQYLTTMHPRFVMGVKCPASRTPKRGTTRDKARMRTPARVAARRQTVGRPRKKWDN